MPLIRAVLAGYHLYVARCLFLPRLSAHTAIPPSLQARSTGIRRPVHVIEAGRSARALIMQSDSKLQMYSTRARCLIKGLLQGCLRRLADAAPEGDVPAVISVNPECRHWHSVIIGCRLDYAPRLDFDAN
jgi:hypothetical protein